MPTPTIRPRLFGRHYTAVTLTGYSPTAGTGVLVAGDSVVLTLDIRSLHKQLTPKRSEVSASNTTRDNEYIISDGATASLEVFKINGGTDTSPLETMPMNYDYFCLTWVEGTVSGGGIKTCTFWGVRGEYADGLDGKGEQIATFQLGPVDPGFDQYSVVYS